MSLLETGVIIVGLAILTLIISVFGIRRFNKNVEDFERICDGQELEEDHLG